MVTVMGMDILIMDIHHITTIIHIMATDMVVIMVVEAMVAAVFIAIIMLVLPTGDRIILVVFQTDQVLQV